MKARRSRKVFGTQISSSVSSYFDMWIHLSSRYSSSLFIEKLLLSFTQSILQQVVENLGDDSLVKNTDFGFVFKWSRNRALSELWQCTYDCMRESDVYLRVRTLTYYRDEGLTHVLLVDTTLSFIQLPKYQLCDMSLDFVQLVLAY